MAACGTDLADEVAIPKRPVAPGLLLISPRGDFFWKKISRGGRHIKYFYFATQHKPIKFFTYTGAESPGAEKNTLTINFLLRRFLRILEDPFSPCSTINNSMYTVTVGHRNYTRFFAIWPRRVTSGGLVWFSYYYLRPGANGLGILLTWSEVVAESR